MANRKRHSGEPGYITERMNPYVPGTKVVIYYAAEQGIDVDGCRYAVVCDAHSSICGETSLPKARRSMKDPSNFCDGCRALCRPGPTDEEVRKGIAMLKREIEHNRPAIERIMMED